MYVNSDDRIGIILGPLLFLFVINDLSESISSSATLFAEDCLVYPSIHSPNDAIQQHEDLDQLGLWINAWQITLNLNECSVIIFLAIEPRSTKHTINWFTLNWVPGVKYLGASIHSMMSWSDRIDDICTKAKRLLGFICWNLHNCPHYARNLAYASLVCSI